MLRSVPRRARFGTERKRLAASRDAVGEDRVTVGAEREPMFSERGTAGVGPGAVWDRTEEVRLAP